FAGAATIQSIMWDGRDFTERPFDATTARDITDVVVTLNTASTSSIAGRVTDGSIPLTSGAAVIAFPIESERWSNYGFNPPRLKSVLTTSDGRFSVDGLPPGDYDVIACPLADAWAWLDPGFLANRSGRATTVHLDRIDSKIANLVLSLAR